MRTTLLATLLGAALIAGCGSNADDTAGADNDIVNVPVGSIKDQSETGNCWLYATTAWVESLGANPTTGRAKELSTAYLVYWNFYDQILESEQGFKGVEWTGGSWGGAVELVLRYGFVSQFTMTSEREADADAKLAIEAMNTMNESLRAGALRSKRARHDAKKVRRELDRAFKLKPELVAMFNATFGDDGKRTFTEGATVAADAPILDPKAIIVRVPEGPGLALREAKLTEVIGERGPNDDADDRVGPLAWRKAPLAREPDPAQRKRALRAFTKRIQRALHDGVAVPIAWCVQDEGKDERKRYVKPISGVLDGDCAHETLVVDYEAKLPDGRILKADQDASREDMERALADDVEIIFLRVKNSWGLDDAPKSGFTDLYMPYVESSIRACPERNASSAECQDYSFMIEEVTLPPGY